MQGVDSPNNVKSLGQKHKGLSCHLPNVQYYVYSSRRVDTKLSEFDNGPNKSSDSALTKK